MTKGMEECLEFLSPQLSEQKTSVNSDQGDGTKNRHTVGRSRHPSAEALAGFRRQTENLYSGPHRLNACPCGMPIELHRIRKLVLGDDRNVCAIENRWMLQRLVFSLSHRHLYQTKILAQITGGRTR